MNIKRDVWKDIFIFLKLNANAVRAHYNNPTIDRVKTVMTASRDVDKFGTSRADLPCV